MTRIEGKKKKKKALSRRVLDSQYFGRVASLDTLDLVISLYCRYCAKSSHHRVAWSEQRSGPVLFYCVLFFKYFIGHFPFKLDGVFINLWVIPFSWMLFPSALQEGCNYFLVTEESQGQSNNAGPDQYWWVNAMQWLICTSLCSPCP